MMSIYIAGPSTEGPRARKWAAELVSAGHYITSRWFDGCEAWSGKDADQCASERVKTAYGLCLSIDLANTVWVLMPTQYSGALVELGYAIARGKRVVTSGLTGKTVFSSLATEFPYDPYDAPHSIDCADRRALEYILGLGK